MQVSVGAFCRECEKEMSLSCTFRYMLYSKAFSAIIPSKILHLHKITKRRIV